MNYEQMQAAARAADAVYNNPNATVADKQAAVANRNAAVAAYQNYLSTYKAPVPSPPAPSPAASPPSPPPPPPTPPSPWLTDRTFAGPIGIKQAQPDIILDSSVNTSGDYIVERFFEELGGTELINLSRYDLIDGIPVTYNPIANLSRLRRRFNPNNIIAIDFLFDDEFSRASIDLLSRGVYEPYFDDNGDLVIEIDIIKPEENIEAEISLTGTVSRV